MKFIAQHDQMDCGPACLAMVSHLYGKDLDLSFFREKSCLSREGVSLLGIKEAAGHVGLETLAFTSTIEDIDETLVPSILHWNQNHFVLLYDISKKILTNEVRYKIADPGHGLVSLSEKSLKKAWLTGEKGVALYLRPTEKFYEFENTKKPNITARFLFGYLKPFKTQFLYLGLLLLFGTFTTLALPLLTQRLIDEGVTKKNMGVISMVLLAQLFFYFGNIVFDVLRNWITLKVGTRININIISSFLERLLKLPISFFDTKMMGDFHQRIHDHERIERFLTSNSLLTLFSIVSFSVFLGILWYYDYRIVSLYISFTLMSIAWSLYWQRKREMLDYFRFQQRSENQESIYEIINGVADLKLNQFEEYKRIEWENIQQRLFKTNFRILKLNQIQLSGFEFANQTKNFLVTFLAAYLVVHDKMTLGALLSVSYIIGQMNSPISQLITFFRGFQDAKLSLKRLLEVQNTPEEEQIGLITMQTNDKEKQGGIRCFDLAFQYEGPASPLVLKSINLLIPNGKITAIVGASGSGKTSLMKLFLRFYDPSMGSIYFNGENLTDISPRSIRENCGVVMQDGYIFSDTIERNIATRDVEIDPKRLDFAAKIANLTSFIEELPMGFKTKIGASGGGLSGGQRQRILIARAVYKDPDYIFFDEATSALDAENEMIIHQNLLSFFKGRTVVIIAHRLSTVRNADQIIVLRKGQILEEGSHSKLIENKGEYYNLVKNQLELGA